MPVGYTFKRRKSTATPFGSLGGVADETYTCERLIGGIYSIPSGTTNKQIDLDWVRATTYVIVCENKKDSLDETEGALVNLTIKTNNSATPGDTVTVVPGTTITWMSGYDDAADKPFNTADVTQIFVTNAGTVDQILTIAVGGDAV